jgi:hypothetical protein
MQTHDRPKGEGGRRRLIGAAGVWMLLSLASCLGIDASLTLNDNGSGKLVYQYRVLKMFIGLKKTDGGPDKPEVPLPVSRQDLEKTIAKAKGLTSSGVEQTETDADIRFDNVAALNKSGLFDDFPIALSREGGQTSLTVLLSDAREPLDATTLGVYDALFAGYGLVLKITVPREIVSPAPGGGSFSADKKTLTYALGLIDYLKLTAKTQLRVSW